MDEQNVSIARELVFVGFNSRVAALDRRTGRELWRWKSGQRGYTTILLDGDRLIVSVMGYTYCLNPSTGEEMWFNELDGMGTGVASLASMRGGSTGVLEQAAAAAAAAASQSAAASNPSIH